MPDKYNSNPSHVLMYAAKVCAECLRAKASFEANSLAFVQIDIEDDEQATIFVGHINIGYYSVPTTGFPHGTALVEPGWGVLCRKLHR